MAVVAGIDEAGYGPILGPLVVSQVTFEVPDEHVGTDLWRLLRSSVVNRISKRDSRLPILDSKLLHQGAGGLKALERSALSMLACAESSSANFAELMLGLCPDVIPELGTYPWYQHFQVSLPLVCDPRAIAVQANAVRRDLHKARCRFLGARCRVLTAGVYNRRVESTRNKATVLWDSTLSLIEQLLVQSDGPLFILIDRQGGRIHHVRGLLNAFDDAQLAVVSEESHHCHYRLRFGTSRGSSSREVNIEFRPSGERHHLPVALASIVSKYIRELFMVAFNRYWQQHVGALKRTAGYFSDGQRFMKDIEQALCAQGVDRNLLVRTR